jgi:predicted metal-binding transcription factor (methanogenesis marker protein 9)
MKLKQSISSFILKTPHTQQEEEVVVVVEEEVAAAAAKGLCEENGRRTSAA